jgi:hypothetical protein
MMSTRHRTEGSARTCLRNRAQVDGGATEVVRRAWSRARRRWATAALGSGLVANGVDVGGAAGVRRNPEKVRIPGMVAIHRLSTVMADEVRRRFAVRRGDHPAG